MESSSLQESVLSIQNRLKIAIQNHQMILTQQDDLSNNEVKNELESLQKHIIALGETQKCLMKQLRKEVEANIRNRSLIHGNDSNSWMHSCRKDTSPKEIKREELSPLSSSSSVTSNDDCKRHENENSDINERRTKLEFMSAVGLVKHDTINKKANKRVKRKRHSTENHMVFVYNKVKEKCRKHNYVSSVEQNISSKNAHSTSSSSSSSVASEANTVPDNSTSRSPSPNIHTSKATTGTNTATIIAVPSLTTLRIPKILPSHTFEKAVKGKRISSLTIERIIEKEMICSVCKEAGFLDSCKSCKANYHMKCIQGNTEICPECLVDNSIKVESKPTTDSKSQSRFARLMSEKFVLLQKKEQLNAEKTQLELRAAELSAAIVAQAASHQSLLHQEAMTCNSIHRIQNLIHTFQKNSSSLSRK